MSYQDIHINAIKKRFIENDRVPSDAEIVDTTWQFVNKSGGPDRRFKYNREIPVALYSQLDLTSDSGLREIFQTSSIEAATVLGEALQQLQKANLNGQVSPIVDSTSSS